MTDPQTDALGPPRLLAGMPEYDDTVAPLPASGFGATALDRRVVQAAPAGMPGLELLAEQRRFNLAFSSDPARVPQGPHQGQPPQLPRFVVILVGVLGLAGALWLMRQLSWLIAPAFLALNMVIVVYPLQTILRRYGVPKPVAVVFTAITLFVTLVIIGLVASWAIGEIIAVVPQYLPQVLDLGQQGLDWLAGKGIEWDPSGALFDLDANQMIGAASQVFSGFSGVIGMLGVIISALIMMLLDVPSWGRRIAVAGSSHPRIVAAMREFGNGTRRYWLVCTGFGALMAGLNYVELIILGIPLPLIWALLTWLMTYVPSVGFFFSLIPPLLVALVANGWQTALWMLGVYLVTTWIVQGVFQPKVTGNAVGVNATVSLISLLLWAWVFGPIGALIALPCTQLVKSLLVDADPKARWVNALISNRSEARGAAGQT